jgi:hypothetical protein
MSTTMRMILLISCFCLTACSDIDYHEENYKAYSSMDKMVEQIVESLKTGDEESMLSMLDNDALIFDLLNSSKGKDAAKTKAFLSTKQGRLSISRKEMSRKQRINAFFGSGLATQIRINKQAFKSSGYDIQKESPYSEGLSAQIQSYRIMLDNADDKKYAYDIEVIYCKGNYHLIEAAGFLNLL